MRFMHLLAQQVAGDLGGELAVEPGNQPPRLDPLGQRAAEQRRVGIGFLEILADHAGIGDGQAVVLDQRRHGAGGVQLQIFGPPLPHLFRAAGRTAAASPPARGAPCARTATEGGDKASASALLIASRARRAKVDVRRQSFACIDRSVAGRSVLAAARDAGRRRAGTGADRSAPPAPPASARCPARAGPACSAPTTLSCCSISNWSRVSGLPGSSSMMPRLQPRQPHRDVDHPPLPAGLVQDVGEQFAERPDARPAQFVDRAGGVRRAPAPPSPRRPRRRHRPAGTACRRRSPA